MPDPQVILTQRFRDAVAAAVGAEHRDADPLIRAAQNPEHGDYQSNLAMGLAKKVGAKPRDLAQKVVDKLDWGGVCSEAPTIAGPGFINLRLSPAFVAESLAASANDAKLGVVPATPAQTVALDYSGPNVAKEMHVGHLRSTCIGDAIARVLQFQGHHVIRQNHLGDWGTQFGMLIERLVLNDTEENAANTTHAFADLGAFYREAKERFDGDPAFADRSRKRVVKLQSGDKLTLKLWERLVRASQIHFRAVYDRLGVLLTDADIKPESFYNDKLAGVAAELEKLGVARISEGALCAFPPGFKGKEGEEVPLIVRKTDGGYGYDTTDLAAVRYRAKDLHAHRLIYVTDARQKQHFAMVFKTAEMAGWLAGVSAEHVPFGAVLGEGHKPFKTRSGDTVKLVDLLDEAEQRALKIIEAKNPELPREERENVARVLGIGAVKYADLVNDRIKDYVFDWDRMLSFDGNTAPYLVNAYVRIQSIFRKAKTQGIDVGRALPAVNEPAEKALALKLLQFPGVVEAVGQSLEPHRLCGYLYELASLYHQFYERCPVLTAETPALRDGRLALSGVTARTLKQGLELLGIGVLERM